MDKKVRKTSKRTVKSGKHKVGKIITEPSIFQYLEKIYNNTKVTPSTIQITGINEPWKIGLGFLANHFGLNTNSLEDIIFKKNNKVTIPMSSLNRNRNFFNSRVVQPPTSLVSYTINPNINSINLTIDELCVIHYLESENQTSWNELIEHAISATYYTNTFEYSAMIGTLSFEDEFYFVSAEELVRILVQRGFVQANM